MLGYCKDKRLRWVRCWFAATTTPTTTAAVSATTATTTQAIWFEVGDVVQVDEEFQSTDDGVTKTFTVGVTGTATSGAQQPDQEWGHQFFAFDSGIGEWPINKEHLSKLKKQASTSQSQCSSYCKKTGCGWTQTWFNKLATQMFFILSCCWSTGCISSYNFASKITILNNFPFPCLCSILPILQMAWPENVLHMQRFAAYWVHQFAQLCKHNYGFWKFLLRVFVQHSAHIANRLATELSFLCSCYRCAECIILSNRASKITVLDGFPSACLCSLCSILHILSIDWQRKCLPCFWDNK